MLYQQLTLARKRPCATLEHNPYKRVTLPSCQLLLFTLEDQEKEQRGGGQVGADPGTEYTDRWGFSRSQGTTEWVSQKHIHTRLCLEVPESQGRAVGM